MKEIVLEEYLGLLKKKGNGGNGRVASVATKNSEGVDIKAFNPTNDSWGQKIGKFFNAIVNKLTGGQYGTAENGQGQETRKGDGSNKQVDVSQFTSNMPQPLNNTPGNLNTGENVQENKEGTSGTFHIEEETGNWNGGASLWEYNGTKDSAKRVEQIKKWEKEFNTKYIIKVEVNE